MSKLRICTTCNRHVRADEPSCPFCVTQRGAPNRIARAAIFTAALASGSAACDKGAVPAKPVPRVVTDAGIATADAATDASAAPVQDEVPDRSRLKMPYGAPPHRGRIV